ncbi:MAG: T9SS type A sorting domain-containing protein [Ignavibacteriae bacterium]|nr:T9SS type A sorting domain-containing protein [Ignavibacteriota bacterium]
MVVNLKSKIRYISVLIVLFLHTISAQTTVFEDPLTGGTSYGTAVGGSFTSEGYKPGVGTGHILYKLPYQVPNGYMEFEIKGFSASAIQDAEGDADNGIFAMYDGRGISEPIQYFNDFKTNFFRWNFHYRQNRGAYKSVLQCAAPTSNRLNASVAVFGVNSSGLIAKDWGEEPTGSNYSTNTTSWYKIRATWHNKEFSVSINGTVVWQVEGPYDYAPIDHKIWLGSAPGHTDKYVNSVPGVVYRNLKVVTYGGSTTPVNSLSISPSTQNVGSSAGSTNIAVSSNVSWNVSDDASWLTIAPTSGSNNGNLSASFTANTGSSSRTATVTVSGGGITRTATITQSGTSTTPVNSLSISPSTQNVGSSAGSTNIAVSSNVSWNVSDDASWLTIAPTSGSNNGNLSASFTANTGSSSRTATVTVSGGGITRTATITQSGTGGSTGGSFINVPVSLNIPSDAGSIEVNVESNIAWTVKDNTGSQGSWITKTPKNGTGNGSVTMKYKVNTSATSRTGNLIFSGGGITKSILVTQAGTGSNSGGGSGNYIDVPSTINISGSAGSFNVNVSSNITWSVKDNTGIVGGWISKSPKNGTGNGVVTVRVHANLTGKSRSGNLIFSGEGITKTITINQSASGVLAKSNGETPEADFSNLVLEEVKEIPNKFSVGNYPNPFNPTTTIQFSLPVAGYTELAVYNSLGQIVEQLISEYKTEGTYNVTFNASKLSSGIYFYTIRSGKFVKTSKMILLE